MSDSAVIANHVSVTAEDPRPLRHTAVVRVTHWITTLCFFALLLSGVEVLLSHPRFYWGEAGNVLTSPLFILPLPASRRSVPTGYGFVLPDQNGWSRALHFEAAWIIVLTGLLYLISGLVTRHFRKNLIPAASGLSWRVLQAEIASHLRFSVPNQADGSQYNSLQRLAYLLVIFVAFPMMIWTGLAMSPAIASVFPAAVSVLGGQQSARTIHFFFTVLLILFLLAHVVMIGLGGFRRLMRAMVTGREEARKT